MIREIRRYWHKVIDASEHHKGFCRLCFKRLNLFAAHNCAGHQISAYKYWLGLTLVGGCSSINQPPVLGSVVDGVYTQPQGNFSCPLSAESIGLQGAPAITDAYRIVKTETIPLPERKAGDWQNNRITHDETRPSRNVKFEDRSGTRVEISSGRRSHSIETTLSDGMGRGNAWLFSKQRLPRTSGQMMSGLMLVPWHNEGEVYMGVDIAAAYRAGQTDADAQLWIRSNLVMAEDVVHTITIQLPAVQYLHGKVHPRDLTAIRDYINARPELQQSLFASAMAWLNKCLFSEVVQ